jgi:hypothetical protein
VKAKIIEEAAYSRLDDGPLGRGRGQVRQDHGSAGIRYRWSGWRRARSKRGGFEARPHIKTQYIKPLELHRSVTVPENS